METQRLSRVRIGGSSRLVLALAVMLGIVAAARAGTGVIHSFEEEGGEYPSTDLVVDADGNIYGTTVQGGENGAGSIFQLAKTPNGWVHTVLYSFTGGADGGQPYGGVTLDAQGNLYGTAVIGGTGGICAEDGCGVAYKLSNSGGTWTQTVLHHFTGGDDGSGPGTGLTIDPDGVVYGMTPTGGEFGIGVLFRLTPGPGGTYVFDLLHTFTGGSDGGTASAGRLLRDGSGNLYGVATVGGDFQKGVAYKLTNTNGTFAYDVIYHFQGLPDAGFPYGGLTFDSSGNLYGTTYYDGANDLGCVYRLEPQGGGTWHETVIYSFVGGSDGASPISNVSFDLAGNLFGTTSEGGPGCGCGTIFRLAPAGGGTWIESLAHAFTGAPDGAFPYNGMVAGSGGRFYGATVHGGEDGDGSIYEFTPNFFQHRHPPSTRGGRSVGPRP